VKEGAPAEGARGVPVTGGDRVSAEVPRPASRASLLVVGARPRTLAAAVIAVAVGTGAALGTGPVVPWRAVMALVVGLAIQIGANFANDYADGVRGTDAARVGPPRLVAGGLASPASVRRAAWGSFAVAGLAGLALALAVAPWLLAVGAAAIAAAWFYTGGPRPYGYLGAGEVFVFLFFGVVAVAGSAFVENGRPSAVALEASVPVGLLIVALLEVNNVRDRAGDAAAGKRTLAVRLGDRGGRRLFAGSVLLPYLLLFSFVSSRPYALIAWASVPLAVGVVRRVLAGADGAELIRALGETARLQLAFGGLFAVGLALGPHP